MTAMMIALVALLLVAVVVLAAGGRDEKALRERALGLGGRSLASLPASERSVIARPLERTGTLARISAWLGLAPGQLPWRRLPVPFVLLAAGLAGAVASWQLTLFVGGASAAPVGLLAAAAILRMVYLWELGRHREEAFRQIPDAVGLMVRAVRAGLPVGEAMRSVAREMPEPTRTEFQRLLAETGIGTPLDRALWGVYERTQVREYAFLSVVVGLQSQTGGGLAEALDNLGDIVRKRVAMTGKAKALAAQARASAGILVALPPFAGGAVSLMQPGYLDALLGDPRGLKLLGISAAMMLTGIVVIRGMIRRATSD